MSYHRRSTGHFVLKKFRSSYLHTKTLSTVVRVLYVGSSRVESGLGSMILGNGSEDPDADLNEPDPIGVVRDDLFLAAIRVSLVPLFTAWYVS